MRHSLLGDSDALEQGERIVTMGNPDGLDFSVVDGVVSAVLPEEHQELLSVRYEEEDGDPDGRSPSWLLTLTLSELGDASAYPLRGQLRLMEEAIEAGDKAAAAEQLKKVQPVVMKSATKGIIHKNTAARKMSRLSARVKALG